MRSPTPVMGWVLIATGLAVFLVRLHHEGPYAFPLAGSLRAALLALLLGGFLVRNGIPGHRLGTPLRWAVLAVSPVVFLFALYSTLIELGEVVTLNPTGYATPPAGLRLWIADHDGAEWVMMRRAKANTYRLDGARADLLRKGELRCVVATLDDGPITNEIHRALGAKYAMQRAAAAIGLAGRDARPSSVALRLDPCPAEPNREAT